jgi:hypothetical protein
VKDIKDPDHIIYIDRYAYFMIKVSLL